MPPKSKPKAPPVKVEKSPSPRKGTKRKRAEVDVDVDTPKARLARAIKQEKQDCDICAESRTTYRHFPKILSCEHGATVCTECYKRHFVMRVDEHRDQGWSACSCPLCGEGVTEEEARGVLPRTVSREIDVMIKKAARQNAHNWLWCPASECGHGQLHNLTKQPWVKCSRCKTKICFTHQRQWHQGLTCVEFDAMANKDEAALKDMEEIRRTTKPCPHCKRRIKKEGGCNHMTCGGCRKQWMWNEVPFDGEKLATSAEILGKRGGAPPLAPEHRQHVEQVIRFQNAEVDRENTQPRTQRQAWPAPARPRLNLMHQDIGVSERGLQWAAIRLAGAAVRVQEALAFNAAPARPVPHHAQMPRRLPGVLVAHDTPFRLLARTPTTVNQNDGGTVIDLTSDDNVAQRQPRPTAVRVRIRRMERPTAGLIGDPIDLTSEEIIDLTAED